MHPSLQKTKRSSFITSPIQTTVFHPTSHTFVSFPKTSTPSFLSAGVFTPRDSEPRGCALGEPEASRISCCNAKTCLGEPNSRSDGLKAEQQTAKHSGANHRSGRAGAGFGPVVQWVVQKEVFGTVQS